MESKEIPLNYARFAGIQVVCTTSYITQTATCLMPPLRLPSELARTTSTAPTKPGAAASFARGSTWAHVFVGVSMNNPLSYYDLNTSLVFYPPPTISTASDVITVVQGQTVTLTIEVSSAAVVYHTRFDEQISSVFHPLFPAQNRRKILTDSIVLRRNYGRPM